MSQPHDQFRDLYLAGGGIWREPAYVLARVKGEALALSHSRPDSLWVQNQACVVLGYVELYGHYEEQEFPWGHVVEKLCGMRKMIQRGNHLANRMNRGDFRTKIVRSGKRLRLRTAPERRSETVTQCAASP